MSKLQRSCDAGHGPEPPGESVLEAFRAPGAVVQPLGNGLINKTFLIVPAAGPTFVLQRLHAIFPAAVNDDIDAITTHLEHKGLITPRLLRTREGARWLDAQGGIWRALTHVPGISQDRLSSPAMAREAGALLARFHRAVADLDYDFKNTRPGIHETARHMANLRAALAQHAGHPRFREISPLARQILDLAFGLPALPPAPLRIVHGDPKINNIIFSADGVRAVCLIDLDTLGRMPLALELGDALRSWCNPAGEDRTRAWFSLELFEAAIAGYAAGATGCVIPAEIAGIVPGMHTIYVELAARFCADALNERYFGWDPSRFASRSEHNQVRAESQLRAAHSLLESQADAEAIIARSFL